MWHDQALVTVGNAIAITVELRRVIISTLTRTPAADGDTFTNGCFLAAGTYTFSVLGRTMHTGQNRLDHRRGKHRLRGRIGTASPARKRGQDDCGCRCDIFWLARSDSDGQRQKRKQFGVPDSTNKILVHPISGLRRRHDYPGRLHHSHS